MTLAATARYDSLIRYYFERAAERYHFDEGVSYRLIVAQVRQESGFDPDAVSPVGARGLLQIMPTTWGPGFEADAFNPEKNLAKGIAHLGYLWDMFKAEQGHERWRFALGAYNAGQGNVISAQKMLTKAGRQTDQWAEIAQMLPAITGPANAQQTTHYVRVVYAEYLATQGEAP